MRSLHVRFLIAFSLVMLSIVLLCASCAWWSSSSAKQDVTEAIDCVKAQERALTKGQSVLDLGIEIAGSFTVAVASNNIEAWLTSEVAKWEEPVVACVLQSVSHASSSSTSALPKTSTGEPISIAAGQVVSRQGWKFAGGAP